MERLKGEGVQDWLSQHLTAPWHGHQTVASELTNDILLNIRERWSQLENRVRVNVLFSLISLKKAQQVELKQKCQELIDHACSDPDDWVRLIAQLLQDYPTEGTLRFNVEQFADQVHLGDQLGTLQTHIMLEGIRFHPKEWTYLNTSVWHPSGSEDPEAPSLHQHFVLKKKFRNNHSERSERLLKLAEKAGTFMGGSALGVGGGPLSPTLLGPGSSIHTPMAVGGASAGGPAPGGTGVATAAAAASGVPGVPGVPGVAPGASGQSGVPGAPSPVPGLPPPRPAKSAGGGLFVNRRPKNINLPRNPSTLPLRSPRLDGPAMPRLNQKHSRIQILDIEQGTEIMQSMKDDKLRQEQEEQRQREQKKEQRQAEIEQKRLQDSEKKRQLEREKEEKRREKEERKRERDDAKKEKDRLRSEREERMARERDGSGVGESRKRAQTDDEEEAEEDASAGAARKRARAAAARSRRQLTSENDYDMQDAPEHVSSPMPTPGLGSAQPTPSIEYGQGQGRDSYFPRYDGSQSQPTQPQASQYPAAASSPPAAAPSEQPLDSPAGHPTLFQNTNLLTTEDRAYITAFLEGVPVIRPNATDTLYQIVMNQEQVTDPMTGKTMYELILIEMNFETGEWRKIKRKRNKPHVTLEQQQQQQPPPPPPQQGFNAHQPIEL